MRDKLGIRLGALKRLATVTVEDSRYEAIWDLCCDHGKLGIELLKKGDTNFLHFVDKTESIIKKLQDRLMSDSLLDEKSYHTYAMDASLIKINSNQNELVVLAGVGGDVAISILENIFKNNELSRCNFLICAHYQIAELREFLKSHQFNLLKEEIIIERERGYEALLVTRKNTGVAISRVGHLQWDLNSVEHKSYLERLIKHYELRVRGKNEEFEKETLALYRELKEGHPR